MEMLAHESYNHIQGLEVSRLWEVKDWKQVRQRLARCLHSCVFWSLWHPRKLNFSVFHAVSLGLYWSSGQCNINRNVAHTCPENHPDSLSWSSFTSTGPQRYSFNWQSDILERTESLRLPLEESYQGDPSDLGLNPTWARNTRIVLSFYGTSAICYSRQC